VEGLSRVSEESARVEAEERTNDRRDKVRYSFQTEVEEVSAPKVDGGLSRISEQIQFRKETSNRPIQDLFQEISSDQAAQRDASAS
jgi:hypothetical protein